MNLDHTDIDRFWGHVDNFGEWSKCWNWKSGLTSDGYGKFKAKGKTLIASRVAYYLATRYLPDYLFVCHKCDNPKCCNPAHLFLGTHTDNLQDASNKGRLRGMPNGRKLQNCITGEIYYSVREAKSKLKTSYSLIYKSLNTGQQYKHIFLRDIV